MDFNLGGLHLGKPRHMPGEVANGMVWIHGYISVGLNLSLHIFRTGVGRCGCIGVNDEHEYGIFKFFLRAWKAGLPHFSPGTSLQAHKLPNML